MEEVVCVGKEGRSSAVNERQWEFMYGRGLVERLTCVFCEPCGPADGTWYAREVSAEDEGEWRHDGIGVDLEHPPQVDERFRVVEPEIRDEDEGDSVVRLDDAVVLLLWIGKAGGSGRRFVSTRRARAAELTQVTNLVFERRRSDAEEVDVAVY